MQDVQSLNASILYENPFSCFVGHGTFFCHNLYWLVMTSLDLGLSYTSKVLGRHQTWGFLRGIIKNIIIFNSSTAPWWGEGHCTHMGVLLNLRRCEKGQRYKAPGLNPRELHQELWSFRGSAFYLIYLFHRPVGTDFWEIKFIFFLNLTHCFVIKSRKTKGIEIR